MYMYIGKKGLYVFRKHVKRLEEDGHVPWVFFSLDEVFIERYFGALAVNWAKKKRDKDMKDFLKRFEVVKDIKDIVDKDESDLIDDS